MIDISCVALIGYKTITNNIVCEKQTKRLIEISRRVLLVEYLNAHP